MILVNNYIGIYDESNIELHCIKVPAKDYGDAHRKFIKYLENNISSVLIDNNVYIIESWLLKTI